MYCRDGGGGTGSFYYKADSSDSGIPTTVSSELEVASKGGESREEVQAVLSLPLLSMHLMKGGHNLAPLLWELDDL